MRNNENRLVKIFRNFRLNKLVKLDYLNAFLINHEIYEMIMRRSKSEHKAS